MTKNNNSIYIYIVLLFTLVSVNSNAQNNMSTITNKGIEQPAWSTNSTIYEVNLRQYAEKSTFQTFVKELPRLKAMGIDILWFMPIHPIGIEGRKGSLGSYYAVQDYVGVSSEYGTMDDFRNLVKAIHAQGMHVIIDWVANHTSPDSKWSKEHPEYFTKGADGKFVPPVPDWSDVIDLNYDNKEMRQAMIESMKFWLTDAKIDGFRCDVAEMVPTDFWIDAYNQLYKVNPSLFMLAEGENPELHQAFHMTYTWSAFGDFRKIAKGEADNSLIDKYLAEQQKNFPPQALRMYFTSNHDENTWNGTEKEMFGDANKVFFILGATLKGMPLVYSGQESALNKRLKFFDKDAIDWGTYPLHSFYNKILNLHKTNPALSTAKASSLTKVNNDKTNQVYSFMRKNGNDEVLVVLNLSNQAVDVSLQGLVLAPQYEDLYTEEKVALSLTKPISLKAFDYRIYVKK